MERAGQRDRARADLAVPISLTGTAELDDGFDPRAVLGQYLPRKSQRRRESCSAADGRRVPQRAAPASSSADLTPVEREPRVRRLQVMR